jgi:hypothetical protein
MASRRREPNKILKTFMVDYIISLNKLAEDFANETTQFYEKSIVERA